MSNRALTSGYNRSTKRLVLQCLFRSVVVSFIAFLLYASFTIIVSGMTTKELGYTIMKSEDGQNFEDIYTHYHSDSCQDENGCDDPRYNEYAQKTEYYKSPIRSTVSPKVSSVTKWGSQIIVLVILYGVIYSLMWKAGDANADMAELGSKKIDKLKGLKVGLIADIPYALLYVTLVITQSAGIFRSYPGIYKILTYFMFGFNDTFMPVTEGGMKITLYGILVLASVLIPIPLFTTVAYFIGSKHIVVKDKIIYEKVEEVK